MDEVIALLILVVFLLSLLLFLFFNGKMNLDLNAEDLQERLDILEEGVKVIAVVLERLPELVPQFTLQNQNPFQPLIEAFAARFRENIEQPSLTDPALRADNGTFTDGPKEEENDPA
jgi:hypothetical protein